MLRKICIAIPIAQGGHYKYLLDFCICLHAAEGKQIAYVKN